MMGAPTIQPQVMAGGMGGVAFPATSATTALVLAISGICCGIFTAIPALIVANGALKITNAHPGHPDAGTAKAAKVVAIIICILMVLGVVLQGALYVWATNLAAEGTNTSTSLNYYTAVDHSDDASTGTSDTLIQFEMYGKDSLSWSFTDIQLSVMNTTYNCSVDGGDACSISQQGGDNSNTWEPGEVILLSESGTDICTDVGCGVSISVSYLGKTMAGDKSVIVD